MNPVFSVGKVIFLITFLVIALYFSMLAHEFGHVVMYKMLGYSVEAVFVSTGRTFATFHVLGIPVHLNSHLFGESYVQGAIVENYFDLFWVNLGGPIFGSYFLLIPSYALQRSWGGKVLFTPFVGAVHRTIYQCCVGLLVPPLGWRYIVNSFEYTDGRFEEAFKPLFDHSKPYAAVRICFYLLCGAFLFLVGFSDQLSNLMPWPFDLQRDGTAIYLSLMAILLDAPTLSTMMLQGVFVFKCFVAYVVLAWTVQIAHLVR